MRRAAAARSWCAGRTSFPRARRDAIDVESYQFSKDATKLLIFTNSARVWRQRTKGTFFVWDFTAKRLLPVSTKPGYQMFAKLSPDGRQVGFVRDNNVFVTDLATGAETALTTDGDENIINGTTDWAYEEELDLRDAFRWSPDGQRIAFWRFDQTAVRPFYLLNADSLYPVLTPVRYPKTGTPNSKVQIGVVELANRPHDLDRPRRRNRHLRAGDGFRRRAGRGLAHPAEPPSEPPGPDPGRREDRLRHASS